MPLWKTTKRTLASMREVYLFGDRVRSWIMWVIGIPAAVVVIVQWAHWPDEWGWRACIILSVLLLWTFSALVVTHWRIAAKADDPKAALEAQYRYGLQLNDAWETAMPGGPELWRGRVSSLYQEVERLLRQHYSAEDAQKFRDINVADDELPQNDEDPESTRRALVLERRLAFIAQIMHPS